MNSGLFLIGGFLILLLLGAGLYVYRNLYYDRGGAKRLERAGFLEKQVQLQDGTTLNYGEGPKNGPPLLLIHGQMTSWKDYVRVLPALSRHFHIFAVDCHGHGKSERNPAKYRAEVMGRDFIRFMETVIGEPAFVSGHSSGGLLTAWIAAHAPDLVQGIVLEDPPFFSTEAERREQTFAWLDGFEPIHRFLNQEEETNYTRFYLENTYLQHFFGDSWKKIQGYGNQYLDKNPGKGLRIFFLPPSLNKAFDLTSGPYDLRFGETFYDGSWFENFDQAEVLSRIQVPALLIHTNWQYSEDGVLLAAMSGEDAALAHGLIKGSKLISVRSGHDFHDEKPKAFSEILIKFKSINIGFLEN